MSIIPDDLFASIKSINQFHHSSRWCDSILQFNTINEHVCVLITELDVSDIMKMIN